MHTESYKIYGIDMIYYPCDNKSNPFPKNSNKDLLSGLPIDKNYSRNLISFYGENIDRERFAIYVGKNCFSIIKLPDDYFVNEEDFTSVPTRTDTVTLAIKYLDNGTAVGTIGADSQKCFTVHSKTDVSIEPTAINKLFTRQHVGVISGEDTRIFVEDRNPEYLTLYPDVASAKLNSNNRSNAFESPNSFTECEPDFYENTYDDELKEDIDDMKHYYDALSDLDEAFWDDR